MKEKYLFVSELNYLEIHQINIFYSYCS